MAKRIRAVYERGVIRPLEPLDLPEGILLEITVEPIRGEEQSLRGGGELLPPGSMRLGEVLEAAGVSEEVRESIEELIEHMASSLLASVDEKLLGLYRAVERLEPGAAAARIGPPPLDRDTWLLMLSDVLTVLEKAGMFEETRPLRAAANQRRLSPYDMALAWLRGDRGYLDRVAEETSAGRSIVYLVAAVLGDASRRAVSRALGRSS